MNDLAPIHVTAKPHPFTGQRIEFAVPEGRNLLQIMEEAQPDPILAQTAHVWINGNKIERQYWNVVRPKSGTSIIVAVDAPEGGGGDGGKNPLRMILTIVVIAAAAFTGGATLPLLGATGSALAAAAVPLIGPMVVNQ